MMGIIGEEGKNCRRRGVPVRNNPYICFLNKDDCGDGDF